MPRDLDQNIHHEDNQLPLQRSKAQEKPCNQDNDLESLSMIRRPFLKEALNLGCEL